MISPIVNASLTTKQLLSLLDKAYGQRSPEALVSLLTIGDGDYFLRLCREEGGGVRPLVEELFSSRPIGKKVSYEALVQLLEKVQQCPRFQSIDGTVELGYKLHVWIGNDYIVHDPFESMVAARRMKIWDRLFHPISA